MSELRAIHAAKQSRLLLIEMSDQFFTFITPQIYFCRTIIR